MVDSLLPRGTLIIYLTILLAMILQVFPLPDWAIRLRPQWPLLVLIYWSMLFPDRVGIFTAMIVGLFVDVMLDALLGQHVLAYAIAIYIVI
ncbi:MAG: rod shape-determining protein MreD, partial [Chromatiales bacterium]